jgi:hypothetical protein
VTVCAMGTGTASTAHAGAAQQRVTSKIASIGSRENNSPGV